jgi:ATP-dependent Lon protease
VPSPARAAPQMGDVMKESTEIAFTVARRVMTSNGAGDAGGFFDKNSLHLHIPEGATPKDGPSAGVCVRPDARGTGGA